MTRPTVLTIEVGSSNGRSMFFLKKQDRHAMVSARSTPRPQKCDTFNDISWKLVQQTLHMYNNVDAFLVGDYMHVSRMLHWYLCNISSTGFLYGAT